MTALSAEELRSWLAESYGLGAPELQDDTSLFRSGRLDSFNLVEIVTWVEERSGTRVRAMDVNLDNFDSVAKIEAFTARLASRNAAAK